MRKVSVSAPASTANLGAGFDCLALALGLRNTVELWEISAGLEVDVEGEGEGRVPLDSTNLILRAAEKVFEKVGRRPAGRRLAPGNALVDGGLTREGLLRLACDLEGHPDNAAAALFGGLTLVSANAEEL